MQNRTPDQQPPSAGAQLLLALILLLAFGTFLAIEGCLESQRHVTAAGTVATLGSVVGLLAKRRTIRRAVLLKAMYVVPSCFGSVFVLAGIAGLLLEFRPRSMTPVSPTTAILEITAGGILLCLALFILTVRHFRKRASPVEKSEGRTNESSAKPALRA